MYHLMRKDQMLIKRNTEHKMQHAKFSRFGNYLPLPAVREEGIYRRKENWKMVISEGKKIVRNHRTQKNFPLYRTRDWFPTCGKPITFTEEVIFMWGITVFQKPVKFLGADFLRNILGVKKEFLIAFTRSANVEQ